MALPPTGYRKPAPTPEPVPEDRGGGARMPYPLGAWIGGKFVFKSPEAEKQWDGDSFMQGSHHLHWMKGAPLSPEENQLAAMGLPPSDDVYQGPDGQRYRPSRTSREDPHLAALRAAHLAAEPAAVGSAFDMGYRASEKALPKALHWMAQGSRAEAQPPAANDNRAAANENQPPAPANTPSPGIGRFAAMVQATKDPASQGPTLAEIGQGADDTVRLTANAITLDNADKLSAAANAVGAVIAGGDYGEAYRQNLAAEQQKTEAARKRLGLLGAAAEVAPTLIPGYGDALGFAGDIKMYREHPEERAWKNYGLTALGILPFVPSVAGSIKKVDRAIDAAEDGAKAVAKEGDEVAGEARALSTDGDSVAELNKSKDGSAIRKDSESESRSNVNSDFSTNYRETFFAANPHLRGKVKVHHAIPQYVLTKYPVLFSEAEIHALENLRGIPNELNSDLHLSKIQREWNRFYNQYSQATREDVMKKVDEIDKMFGHQFDPPRGGLK